MPSPFRSRTLVPAALLWLLGLAAWSCGAPPSIAITSPTHGAFHRLSLDGNTVTVTGQLNCIVFSTATVRLWFDTVGPDAAAVIAPVDASGAFSATLPLPTPNRVLHTVIAEVRYGTPQVGSRRDRVAIHVVDSTVNQGPGDAGTTLLHITDHGLDALEGSLGGTAAGAFDLGAFLWNNLLADPPECVRRSLGVCLARLDEATPTAASLAGAAVDFDAQSVGIETDLQLFDLVLDVHLVGQVRGPFFLWVGFTCDVRMEVDQVDATVRIDLTESATQPGRLEVEQDGPIDVAPPAAAAFDVNCSGVVGGILGDLLDGVSENEALLAGLVTRLEAELNQEAVLEEPLQQALDDLALVESIAAPLHMDLGIDLDGDPVHEAPGVAVVAGIHPQPTATQCHPGQPLAGQGWACQALPDDVYNVMLGGYKWGLGDVTPGGLTYDVAFGLEDTALNLLLRAVTEQGRLSSRVTSLDTCPVLEWGCLVDVGTCAALGVACSDRVDIQVRPALAPLVRGNPGIGGSQTDLIAQFELLFVTPGFTPSWDIPRLRMVLTFEAGLDVAFQGGELGFAFTLCDPEPCAPSFDLHSEYVYFPNVAVGPRLIDAGFLAQSDIEDTIGDLLEAGLTNALDGFPLPTIQGQPFIPVEIDRAGIPPWSSDHQGFITVFGILP